MGKQLKIGCGAGYAGDRIDPAVDLVRDGDLDYLVLECLAERTVALAHLERSRDPSRGYGQLLEERMAALLPYVKEKKTKIITNLGAANPKAALEKTAEIARKLAIGPLKIAALLGADVLPVLQEMDGLIWETGTSFSSMAGRVVSADAYLGADAILPALEAGADVILTGRVADPSLFLAPMIHEFGWKLDDWNRLGQGTVVAHLLECGAQVTGGYFADGIRKRVDNLADIGFPLAQVDGNGSGIITKLEESGGIVDLRTCKEQLLYEIHDPSAYLTPDVTADFTAVTLLEKGRDRVLVDGGAGRPRPESFKVTVGVLEGYLGEGLIGFAGHGAVERALLAREILEKRFSRLALDLDKTKFELIGINALHGHIGDQSNQRPYEVMLRMAVKGKNEAAAQQAVQEVEALWVNGPGGPGGVRKHVAPLVAAYSTTVSRRDVNPYFIYEELA